MHRNSSELSGCLAAALLSFNDFYTIKLLVLVRVYSFSLLLVDCKKRRRDLLIPIIYSSEFDWVIAIMINLLSRWLSSIYLQALSRAAIGFFSYLSDRAFGS